LGNNSRISAFEMVFKITNKIRYGADVLGHVGRRCAWPSLALNCKFLLRAVCISFE
jgi:hypothetical protein